MFRVVFSFDEGGVRRCAGWSGKRLRGTFCFLQLECGQTTCPRSSKHSWLQSISGSLRGSKDASLTRKN